MPTNIFFGTVQLMMRHMTTEQIIKMREELHTFQGDFVPSQFDRLDDLISQTIDDRLKS